MTTKSGAVNHMGMVVLGAVWMLIGAFAIAFGVNDEIKKLQAQVRANDPATFQARFMAFTLDSTFAEAAVGSYSIVKVHSFTEEVSKELLSHPIGETFTLEGYTLRRLSDPNQNDAFRLMLLAKAWEK